ncbi:ribonuclease R [Chitinophaga ginsengisegetis]|uniref:ribonuclease R n=1 Tax=Chitinophaga ginsengisegetis TaxID=393003 RepID=UPI000DBF8355|nr:ribonuclease R [Chitinophaga ginsengisegetis]MDR6567585.1 ribonuclease R [Chitinophaga ginsengisegetis]MDR6647860.1 ribonuclease R [Chitinophaga ginsengisegetis]MDR6654210.1 ribonuclease R [Chitinophaga ginsengisegetis]
MSRKKKNKKGGNHNPNNPQQSHSQKKTFKGILEVTRSGMAFVIVDGLTKDIMVKQKNLHTALDKDEVLVDVLKAAHNDGRMEGIITDILKRNKTEFTGTLQVSKSFAFLIPEKGLFMPDIYIPANSLGEAKSGDKAVVKIVAWGEKSRKPVGEIVEILDASDTNDLAMKEILIEAGFPLSFPKEVIAELDTIQENISEEEVGKRKDIRKILTMTIDPVDAKDFDDAISIRLLKNGLYELGVHIADVSHYVLPGTELDKEADKRATSVYLPDRVLPMLPEKISNELCSLRPHEDKLTFSAMFQMNEKGEVKQHWIGRTVIHSDHRFTYEEVQEIIEGKSDGPYKNEVMLLNRIAQTLRGQRFAHGAINFSSQEVRFKLDETGKPIGIVIKESKEAHQLIEEFMLMANKTIAAYVGKLRINKQPIPFPYRVHDTPDPEKLKVFALFAGKFGYKFDLSTPESIASSFNKMLAQVKGKPEQPVLETLGIRTMAKAIYTVNNVGHYGLGFEDYCHFTSPIRRFPDVLVHRVLAECLANSVRPDKQMEQKCKHSSEMERKAMEAERAGNKYKQVEYMQQFIGHTFDGVISGVAHFGFWVETVDTKCEGLISIHNLNKREEFQYNEGEYSLVGQSTGRKFRIGEKVSIRVVAASLAKRQLDYDLEDELTGTGTPAAAPFQHKRREDRRDDRKGGDHRRDDRKKKKDKQRYKPWEQEAKAPHRAPEVSLSESDPLPVVDQVIVETHVVPVTPDAPETPAVPATPAPAPVHKKKPKKEVTEKVAEEKPVPVVPAPAPAPAPVAEKVVVKKTTAKQEPAVKAPAKKAAAKPAPAAKKAVPAKKAAAEPVAKKAVPAKKAAAKKAVPAKKAAAKPAAKKAVPAKKAAAKPAAKKAVPAKKAAAKPVAKKAVPAKKAAAKPVAKKAVPAKKAATKPVAKKAVPAKKAAAKPVAKKAVPAKKAAVKPVAKKTVPAKKAAAKPVAKKAVPAKKAAAKKAAPAKKAADKSKSKKKSK